MTSGPREDPSTSGRDDDGPELSASAFPVPQQRTISVETPPPRLKAPGGPGATDATRSSFPSPEFHPEWRDFRHPPGATDEFTEDYAPSAGLYNPYDDADAASGRQVDPGPRQPPRQ